MIRPRPLIRAAPLLLGLLVALCASSTATAQITRRVFAEGDIVVPGGPTIPSGTEFTASSTFFGGFPSGMCSLDVRIELGDDVRLSTSTRCQLSAAIPVSAAVRVVWSSPMEVHGAFSTSIANRGGLVEGEGIRLAGALLRTTIDPPAIGEWTATIPAGGTFEVVLRSTADGGGSAFSASSSILGRFTEGGGSGRLLRDGSPCGVSLVAGATDVSQWGRTVTELVLTAHSAPPNAIGFLVFGLADRNLIIPPLNCPFRTDLLVPLFTPVDAAGTARFVVSQRPLGFEARVQFLAATVDPIVGEIWRTSQLIELRL